MLNKAQVIGNLGADPKVSVLGNTKTKAATFTVATTEKGYATQSGTQVPDKTEWHNIVCFGKLAEVVEKYLKKGSKVFVEGKMRTRSYDDRQGIKRYIMEINAETIEMLDSRPSTQTAQQEQIIENSTRQKEDDLPF